MSDILSINIKPNPLISTYEECRLYTRHYARSFYFSSFLLPKQKRNAAYAVYSFCRYADNIVDMASNHSPDEVEQKINSLLENLDDVYTNKDTNNNSFSAFADTVRKYVIPKNYFTELVEGMCMDIKTKRYETFADLEKYCYKVASVVGLIMSEIFGYSNSAALNYAVHLGNAMQLTNILRDIYDDQCMGRVYIPQEELRSFSYSENDIKKKVVNNNFISLVKYQIERARSFYNLAEKGIPYLTDDGSRTTVVLMQKIYSAILNKIEEKGYDIYSERVYVSRTEKISIMTKYAFNFSEKRRLSKISLTNRLPAPASAFNTTADY
jgi:15-cis-phytoene synthase